VRVGLLRVVFGARAVMSGRPPFIAAEHFRSTQVAPSAGARCSQRGT